MIHFDKTNEPVNFDADVRRPGLNWLAKHPHAGRPKDYWNEVKFELADAFSNLCAYSCMRVFVGTVDHFISCRSCLKGKQSHRIYEWDNYRYASGWINSSKQNADDSVLDPFEVEDGWFEVLLPLMQLIVSKSVPDAVRAKAEYTLARLHLQDDERVVRQREAWYREFGGGDLSLEGLRRFAPLIARAVEARVDD